MSLIGKRFRVSKYEDYLWIVTDEDSEFLYARYLPDQNRRIYKQIKSVLVKYPLDFQPDLQLTLF